MTIRGLWQTDNGDRLKASRDLLRGLLDKGIVSALLVSMEGANDSVMPALVRDSDRLRRANPFAPVMAFNGARLVARLTREEVGTKVGAVLRSCEIRALVELVKFNQARLDNLVVVGVDCLGTFAVPDYRDMIRQSPDITARLLSGEPDKTPGRFPFRTACTMCERPTRAKADIWIGFIGVDDAKALAVEVRDDLSEPMGLRGDASFVPAREQAMAHLVAARTAARDAILDRFREQVRSDGRMASYFADCIECTNCMNACPICYCKECFFRTANAERTPGELLRSAERRGALTMPPDAILFQLTRLNHMATSCVGCGMCEAACPHHIPLTAMFCSVGARVQKIFKYEPGLNVNDKPPFMTFQQNEFLEIGQAK